MEEDDELSFDLSKIKSFFKGKKEETEKKVDASPEKEQKTTESESKSEVSEIKQEPTGITETKQDNDEVISIDFTKIKNFFKGKKEETEKREEEKKEQKKSEQEAKSEVSEIKKETNKDPEEKQKDDEIAIDLSWVKNIFKKEEKHVDGDKPDKKETEDEISIDFSKLKNIKNIFKKSSKETESDEDINFDIKKISNFFVQHRVLIFLLIPIFLSISLRVQPAYLPITDEWATNSVINNLRSQVSSQINQQYPNLPDQNKNALVESELQKILQQQKAQIDQQITETSNFFKSRLQDDTGQTYLLAIDPYFWMRAARNILKNGHPGDKLSKDGRPFDNHMLAPNGRIIPFDKFNAYFPAYIFKFLSFFNKNLNLMTVSFYVPVLISALAVIPAFFITRKLVGNFGGFIAATVVAIHPSFLARTVGGFADTDAYNVMLPLFIAWIFLEALDAKSTKNSVILSTSAGLLVGLYSFTWGGWWYVFDFILISTILYISYYTFVHRKELIRNFVDFTKQKAIKKLHYLFGNLFYSFCIKCKCFCEL